MIDNGSLTTTLAPQACRKELGEVDPRVRQFEG